MKDLGHWMFVLENKDISYILTTFKAIKENFRNMLTPKVVTIGPRMPDKKVEGWEDVERLIDRHKMPIYSIRLHDIRLHLKIDSKKIEMDNSNILFVHTSYTDYTRSCFVGISTASDIWLKPGPAKVLEQALRGIAMDLGVKPEFETERPDLVEVWAYGLRPAKL